MTRRFKQARRSRAIRFMAAVLRSYREGRRRGLRIRNARYHDSASLSNDIRRRLAMLCSVY
jgi:hypothetical protein